MPRKPLRRNGTVALNRILLGVIGRPHGVRGLVHVVSHTADPANLAAYGPLTDDRGRRFTLRWRGEGLAEVTELRDGVAVPITDRTTVEKLVNTRLYLDRAQLPEPDADEFYLADLIGMTAVDTTGTVLGEVTAVHDYGAGASLEIATEGAAPLLVPFTRVAVPGVDLPGRRVAVVPPDQTDWVSETPSARAAAAQRSNVGEEATGPGWSGGASAPHDRGTSPA